MVDEAAQHARGAAQLSLCSLTEEIRQSFRRLFLQIIYDAAEEHCLAFAGVALDPEQPALRVVTKSLKEIVLENPAVGALEQAALCLLDALLVGAGVSHV